MAGFKQWPPRCLNPRAEAGVWVVPGPALQWHRGCFWQSCHHTPHKWSHSSFTKGSKNICWVIKGSHSTAYVLARLSDSLKSPVWSCFDQGEKQVCCLYGCQTLSFWGHWWYLWRHTGVGEPCRGARAGMGSHGQQRVRSGRAALQATTALCGVQESCLFSSVVCWF